MPEGTLAGGGIPGPTLDLQTWVAARPSSGQVTASVSVIVTARSALTTIRVVLTSERRLWSVECRIAPAGVASL